MMALSVDKETKKSSLIDANELVEEIPVDFLEEIEHVAKIPAAWEIAKNAYEIIGQAVEFFEFPAACLKYQLHKIAKKPIPPEPPWKSKYGWTKFILSIGALTVGIMILATPGLGVVLGVAAASISVVRALFTMGLTLYKIHQKKKELSRIMLQLSMLKGKKLEEQRRLQAQKYLLEKNINHLSFKKRYINIAEKSFAAGIAILTLAGAIITLSNPIIASIISTAALAFACTFCMYKFFKWSKRQYINYKEQRLKNRLNKGKQVEITPSLSDRAIASKLKNNVEHLPKEREPLASFSEKPHAIDPFLQTHTQVLEEFEQHEHAFKNPLLEKNRLIEEEDDGEGEPLHPSAGT